MYKSIECPECKVPDLELDITIESFGRPSSYFEPGEGAVWHLAEDVTCAACGFVLNEEYLNDNYQEQIQEWIAEYDADRGYD